MALAMTAVPTTRDADLMDIDIDLDVDIDPTHEDDIIEEGEEPSFAPSTAVDNSGIIPAIYTEDESKEPQWEKVHMRGVDDLHTNDILAFSNDHFPEIEAHVQWVDDTSANLVYKTNELARQAILAFVQNPTTWQEIQNTPFELRTAKPLATRPGSMIMVRVAQAGDRKRKNAHQASRYYLLHPDQDPSERLRQEFAKNKPHSGGENGDYRRRRFDDQEHRRRRDKDHNADNQDFAASMYDDAPSEQPVVEDGRGRDLFSRVSRDRRRSASPGANDSDTDNTSRRHRDRSPRRSNLGKELFTSSNPPKSTNGGGLHSDHLAPGPTLQRQSSSGLDRSANAAAAKRLKADLLASSQQTSPRSNKHRRSHAMDAKNEEDLVERFARKTLSMDSTTSNSNSNFNSRKAGIELFPSSTSTELNIRGSAAGDGDLGFSIKGGGGLSIKGRAANVKELFPQQYERKNTGKELFDEPVREKMGRKRAGDLFD